MVNVEQRFIDSELKAVCAVSERVKTLKLPFSPLDIRGAKSFTMKLGGRMIVDHAGGVLENANLCIHRHYGFPYIPGSAVKGIARHAAWCEWADGGGNEEIAKNIAKVFGCPTGEKALDSVLKQLNIAEQSGSVSFLPAYPTDNKWKLVVDVLTSHGGCDTKNPIPIFFPAVEKGATFSFSIVPINGRSSEEDLAFAVKYLQQGLTNNGVGAKTAAGYGWFKGGI
jgi:CRISPR type III-B/RAMP module RAMP protein Cmr6